jgi:hypothetical protein
MLLASSSGQGSIGSMRQHSSSSNRESMYAMEMFDGWLKFVAELSRLAPHCKFVAAEQQQAVCRQLAQDFPQLLQQYLRLLLLCEKNSIFFGQHSTIACHAYVTMTQAATAWGQW